MKKAMAILICLLTALCSFAKQLDNIRAVEIRVRVINEVTKRAFFHGTIDIFNASDSTWMGQLSSRINVGPVTYVGGKLNVQDMDYLLYINGCYKQIKEDGRIKAVEADDFEPAWVRVNKADLDSCQSYLQLPDITLSKKRQQQLKELEVNASIIKFYHRGDTLVYNANAFVTSHGSMLDELLMKMPGVKLSNTGEIFVHNRKVSTLLVNGKDLFDSNNSLLLENLGSYAIKEILFYDKLGKRSRILGEGVVKDTSFTMDVRLKKEYSMGWLANIIGGYGTRNKYLGKLFGLKFSDNVSISTNFNANNLSDYSTPGKTDGAWSLNKMESGVKSKLGGGVNYSIQTQKLEGRGSIEIGNINQTTKLTNYTERLLSNSPIYEYSRRNIFNKDFSIKFHNKFIFLVSDRVNLEAFLSLTSNRQKDYGDLNFYSFNAKQENSSNLFNQPDITDNMQFVNGQYSKSQAKENGLTLWATTKMETRLNGGRFPNSLQVLISVSSYHNKQLRDNNYVLSFHNQPYNTIYSSLIKTCPKYSINGDIHNIFTQFIPEEHIEIPISYSFHCDYQKTNTLYGVETPGNSLIISPELSSRFHGLTYSHCIKLSIKRFDAIPISFFRKFDFAADFSAYLTSQKFHLVEYNSPININRTTPTYDASLSIYFKVRVLRFMLSLKSQSKVVPLNSIISTPITNPYYIRLGNSNLKGTQNSTAKFGVSSQYKATSHNLDLQYTLYHRSIVSSMNYNDETGVFTSWQSNTSGDNYFSVGYSLQTTFKRNSPFDYSFNCKFQRNKLKSGLISNLYNVSCLKVFNASSKISWNYKNYNLSLSGSAKYTKDNTLSESFKSWNNSNFEWNIGGSFLWNFLQTWSIATDCAFRARTGYYNNILNSKECLWNARISKSLLKGNLILIVDAYDILNQTKRINLNITPEARTETISNVIPSYVLFHIQYRFNKQPKHLRK